MSGRDGPHGAASKGRHEGAGPTEAASTRCPRPKLGRRWEKGEPLEPRAMATAWSLTPGVPVGGWRPLS